MKGIDGRAQILANSMFFRIESDTFANTLQTTFTPDMEHHLEADNIRVLFDNALLLVVSVERPVSLRVEIRRVMVPIGLGRCQTTHLIITIFLIIIISLNSSADYYLLLTKNT